MKNIFKGGRKIPFENVVRNLRAGKYSCTGIDYANGGVTLFCERKFADNLGVTIEKLYEMKILEKGDQNGWNLVRVPDYKKLEGLKAQLVLN